MTVQGLAFLSLVGFQIRQRDQAAMSRHFGSQLLRSFTIIEIARTAIPYPLQSGSQFRLNKFLAIARVEKNPLRFGESRQSAVCSSLCNDTSKG